MNSHLLIAQSGTPIDPQFFNYFLDDGQPGQNTSHLGGAQSQLARPRLALTARVILKALLKGYAKHHCHFERGLERGRIFVLFHGYDRLPCHTDFVRELLLRDLTNCSEFSNLIAYSWH